MNYYGKSLFYLQFAAIVIWLIVIGLHFESFIKGKYISILFIALGIIFLLFHFSVIINYKENNTDKNKKIETDKKIE